MRLALTGRNLTITPALRQAVTRRLEKLDRLLHDRIISAQVALQVQKDRVKSDVLVHTRGGHALSGHGEAATAQASVTDAIAKVQHQATRVKGKLDARKRRGDDVKARAAAQAVQPEPEAAPAPRRASRAAASAKSRPAAGPAPKVIRVRRTTPKPMQLDDALLRLEAEPGSVLMFRDAVLDRVQVLVRRADGNVSLVDTDV